MTARIAFVSIGVLTPRRLSFAVWSFTTAKYTSSSVGGIGTAPYTGTSRDAARRRRGGITDRSCTVTTRAAVGRLARASTPGDAPSIATSAHRRPARRGRGRRRGPSRARRRDRRARRTRAGGRGASTAMRCARRPASPRKWVHSTTVRPCSAASVPMRSITSRVGLGIEARRRLVEEQHLGVVQQRAPQGDPLALAGREALHSVVGSVGHAEPVEHRASPSAPASSLFIPRIRPVTTRFSRAVSRSSSPAFSVSTPVRRRTSLPSTAGSRPSTRLLPRSGASTPLSRRTVVVLPAPFGPSTASTSPGWASNERSTRAS